MDVTVDIRRETHATGGRYVATADGLTGEGELIWRNSAPGVIVATHTGVPVALQGKGIAARLVERLVADARTEGVRIVPACSYVAAQRKRHPEWDDVFTSG